MDWRASMLVFDVWICAGRQQVLRGAGAEGLAGRGKRVQRRHAFVILQVGVRTRFQ